MYSRSALGLRAAFHARLGCSVSLRASIRTYIQLFLFSMFSKRIGKLNLRQYARTTTIYMHHNLLSGDNIEHHGDTRIMDRARGAAARSRTCSKKMQCECLMHANRDVVASSPNRWWLMAFSDTRGLVVAYDVMAAVSTVIRVIVWSEAFI